MVRIQSGSSADIHELYKDSTFRKIFIEKNDSAYRDFFGRSFVNTPVQAFLISCTYYLLKKDKVIERDIEAVRVELKGRYGIVPDIKFKKED